MHQHFNYIKVEELYRMHKNGSKCIDLVVVTPEILQWVEGSKLCEINEIVEIDHRFYVIDINMEGYFNGKLSE